MPKEIVIQKDRQELLQEKLEGIVASLLPLTNEEQIRVLRTTVVFFGLERAIEIE